MSSKTPNFRVGRADFFSGQVHTSKLFHGQIYMPLANVLLMVGTIIVTAAYSNVSIIRIPFSYISVLIQDRQPG
jgi:K+ potassium transporter